MKRLFLIIITMVLITTMYSCAIVQTPYVSYDKNTAEPVKSRYEIYKALENYPRLEYYYDEGVVDIISVKKVKATDTDSPEYIIKYRYCKHYITDYGERMEALREGFPEVYNLYCNGRINLTEMYEYVDRNGHIQTHISYYFIGH